MKDDYILQLAHALRQELPTLIIDIPVRSRLAQCIDDAEHDVITTEDLLQMLAQEPNVERWLSARLDKRIYHYHIDLAEPLSYQTLPGEGGAVETDEFVCPNSTACPSWHRQRVGQKPPLCAVHQVPLVPKQ